MKWTEECWQDRVHLSCPHFSVKYTSAPVHIWPSALSCQHFPAAQLAQILGQLQLQPSAQNQNGIFVLPLDGVSCIFPFGNYSQSKSNISPIELWSFVTLPLDHVSALDDICPPYFLRQCDLVDTVPSSDAPAKSVIQICSNVVKLLYFEFFFLRCISSIPPRIILQELRMSGHALLNVGFLSLQRWQHLFPLAS